jgi:DNA-binding transcriptional regulator YbjK
MTHRWPLDGSTAPLHPVRSEGEESRADRLVAVAARQIAEQGLGAVSARSVAAAAGAAASAVNYNLGGMERLLSRAFEHGAAQTADWLTSRADELRALPRSPASAAGALEYMVTAWTRSARPLALLYQEHLAAAPAGKAGAAWTGLWRDFWLETADTFGLDEVDGRLLHLFFESECLYHLSTWSPALEVAALRELAQHFAALWLDAPAGPSGGALALAERTAGARAAGSLAPGALKIAEAAAEVLQDGLGGLTHRAVAARVGVTTGAVTHHFRTIEDLVAGAIRGQVMAMTPASGAAQGSGSVEQPLSVQDLVDNMRRHALPGEPAGPALTRRHLFLAAVRRPELAGCAAVIRFAHGGTTRGVLDRLFDIPPEILPLHAGVLSRLLSALWHGCAADAAPAESGRGLLDVVTGRLFQRLPTRPPR